MQQKLTELILNQISEININVRVIQLLKVSDDNTRRDCTDKISTLDKFVVLD